MGLAGGCGVLNGVGPVRWSSPGPLMLAPQCIVRCRRIMRCLQYYGRMWIALGGASRVNSAVIPLASVNAEGCGAGCGNMLCEDSLAVSRSSGVTGPLGPTLAMLPSRVRILWMAPGGELRRQRGISCRLALCEIGTWKTRQLYYGKWAHTYRCALPEVALRLYRGVFLNFMKRVPRIAPLPRTWR